MSHLSLLIKPAAGLCNIRCTYCFYRDLSELRTNKIMTRETADILIQRAVDSGADSVTFAFQGGEPTLAGLDFFEYFVSGVNKRNINKININYAVQTNGMNITQDFADFFRENKFLAGLSVDGTKEIHDFFRTDSNGGETFTKILKCADLFDRTGVDYNILTVVTAQVAKHIEKIYKFYKKRGFYYLQFITCLDPLDPFNRREANFYSLTPELYEKFLIRLFDLWYADFMADNYISVRFFDNLVRAAAGEPCEQCGLNADGSCPGQFVVESDGSVYPCDFYCLEHWRIGDIFSASFAELDNSENMLKFRKTSELISGKCTACDMFGLCKGGCRRDREESRYNKTGENKYCGALYNFLSYAEPMLVKISKTLK